VKVSLHTTQAFQKPEDPIEDSTGKPPVIPPKMQESSPLSAQSVLSGSVPTRRHINLHGEYDFPRDSANDDGFDLDRTLALSLG